MAEIETLNDEIMEMREALYSIYYEVNPRFKDTFSDSKLSPDTLKKIHKLLFDEQKKGPEMI